MYITYLLIGVIIVFAAAVITETAREIRFAMRKRDAQRIADEAFNRHLVFELRDRRYMAHAWFNDTEYATYQSDDCNEIRSIASQFRHCDLFVLVDGHYAPMAR